MLSPVFTLSSYQFMCVLKHWFINIFEISFVFPFVSFYTNIVFWSLAMDLFENYLQDDEENILDL